MEGKPVICQDRGSSTGGSGAAAELKESRFQVAANYPPANFFLATGRASAFVGPCPLFAITLP